MIGLCRFWCSKGIGKALNEDLCEDEKKTPTKGTSRWAQETIEKIIKSLLSFQPPQQNSKNQTSPPYYPTFRRQRVVVAATPKAQWLADRIRYAFDRTENSIGRFRLGNLFFPLSFFLPNPFAPRLCQPFQGLYSGLDQAWGTVRFEGSRKGEIRCSDRDRSARGPGSSINGRLIILLFRWAQMNRLIDRFLWPRACSDLSYCRPTGRRSRCSLT